MNRRFDEMAINPEDYLELRFDGEKKSIKDGEDK